MPSDLGRARNGLRMNVDQQQTSGTALLAIVNRRAVLGSYTAVATSARLSLLIRKLIRDAAEETGFIQRVPVFDVASFAVVIGRARNGPRMNGDQHQSSAGIALLAIVNREPFLAQARGRLAVDDRRGDRVKVASQCPCVSVGAPHLDHGVGGMTAGGLT